MSREIIEIKGKHATLYEIYEDDNGKEVKDAQRTVLVESLFDEILSRMPTLSQTPILPDNTRCYACHGDTEVVLVELPPQVRTIFWSDQQTPFLENLTGAKRQKYIQECNLAFPYVVMVFTLKKGEFGLHRDGDGGFFPKCFYRNSPIISMNDRLYHTNLYNVRTADSCLCLHPKMDARKTSLCDKINFFSSELWNEIFTTNMGSGDDFHFIKSEKIDPRLGSLESWQEASEKPHFMFSEIKWPKTDFTVEKVIASALPEKSKSSIKSAADLADIFSRV